MLHREKEREDRLRALASGFARWGSPESVAPALLLPILAQAGIVPLRRQPTLDDWAAIAREAMPTPLWEPDRVLLTA